MTRYPVDVMPKQMFPLIAIGAAILALALPTPARAELPEGVRAMIEAAMETGDEGKIKTVLALARQTHPDGAEEIDTIEKGWKTRRAEAARLAREEKARKIEEAGLFDLWSGEGQLGGFDSSGNSNNIGLSAGLKLKRQGKDWSHALRATADYQRSNGVTSREQFLFAYEPRYQTSDELFFYGLAQYERNALQGFTGRYAVSGGVGYQVANSADLKLSVKAGPALRLTDFEEGENETRLAALFGFDFDWRIAERLTFTQDANMVAETGGAATVIVDSTRTTLNLVTGLDAKVSDRLRSRVTYAVDYDSKPPAGKVSTDTITRLTLVYDF
ncbi:DUF481 domain-containing protein [Pelagerythrobacter marensis]|uniref:DUF481 domain-containing protein n=1 Tax=Pelagerythrobacter marensis TaxID=543877 RepID=A0ABZ2D572_9SPHN